jgi:hypothetical protein
MFFLIVVNIVLTINLFNPNNPTKIFNNIQISFSKDEDYKDVTFIKNDSNWLRSCSF